MFTVSAEDAVFLADDLAIVDADPKFDPPFGIDADVPLGQAALDRHRAIDRGGCAGELRQDRVAPRPAPGGRR